MNLRHITKFLVLLYFGYVLTKSTYILISPPQEEIMSFENFNKLSTIQKSLVITIGLPIYISIEIVPKTIAYISRFIWINVTIPVVKFLWNNVIIQYIIFMKDIIEFVWNGSILLLEFIKCVVNDIYRTLVWFWCMGKECWYWIYTPIKEWIVQKLYQAYELILCIGELSIQAKDLCKQFIYYSYVYIYECWCYLSS